MAITEHQVRDRIAAGILAGLPSWTQSRFLPEAFGRDTAEQRHKGFSVAVPQTIFPRPGRQNNRRGATTRGEVVTTEVVVRWGWQITAGDSIEDYGEALDAEALVIAAVLDTNRDPQLGIRIVSAVRSPSTGDELHVLGQLNFECLHRRII